MIYDRALSILRLTTGTPIGGTLEPVSIHLYAPREVYYRRYWESIIAGTQIDTMVELPGHPDIISGMFAQLEDEHLYRIEQSQQGSDADGLPVTILSLRRASDNNFDIAGGEVT